MFGTNLTALGQTATHIQQSWNPNQNLIKQPTVFSMILPKPLNNTTTSFKRTSSGKVFQYESDGAYVDIGGKSAAFVPLNELLWNQ